VTGRKEQKAAHDAHRQERQETTPRGHEHRGDDDSERVGRQPLARRRVQRFQHAEHADEGEDRKSLFSQDDAEPDQQEEHAVSSSRLMPLPAGTRLCSRGNGSSPVRP
jgi:hypothetical protein